MRAIRTRRFKYIRNFETAFLVEVPGDVQQGMIFRHHTSLYSGAEHPPVELYDLEADPLEQHNLAGAEPLHEVESRLDSQLRTWMERTDDPLLRGPVPSPLWQQIMESWSELTTTLHGDGESAESLHDR
jgi:arylsulfatase A-like enzyme